MQKYLSAYWRNALNNNFLKINPLCVVILAIAILITAFVVNGNRFTLNPMTVTGYNDYYTTLYLELMKKCLAGLIYEDDVIMTLDDSTTRFNFSTRTEGRDWPKTAHTMIGLKRLNNIEFCATDVIQSGIEGDFIETGVWRGGAVIFMRSILKAFKIADRTVWVADSFNGYPPPNATLYPADEGIHAENDRNLKISLDSVRKNFQKYGLLDDQVKFLKGWFRDTLSNAPIRKLSLLRLDGDLYESTMNVLVALYPKLSIGGYVIIDDYVVFPSCFKAVHDYRKSHNVTDEIVTIDSTGVFWKKTK